MRHEQLKYMERVVDGALHQYATWPQSDYVKETLRACSLSDPNIVDVEQFSQHIQILKQVCDATLIAVAQEQTNLLTEPQGRSGSI
jgi:hypothetical protein